MRIPVWDAGGEDQDPLKNDINIDLFCRVQEVSTVKRFIPWSSQYLRTGWQQPMDHQQDMGLEL